MAFFGLVKREVKAPQEIPRVGGPKLKVLIKGLDFERALKRAEKGKLVLPSNKRLDDVLVGDKTKTSVDRYPCGTYTHTWVLPSEEYALMKEAFPAWSGTMVGYPKPGKKLGSEIVYVDQKTNRRYVFPVPKAFSKERNALILVEHPNYTIVYDRGDAVIAVWREADLSLIIGFPQVNSRCIPDKVHRIPQERGSAYIDTEKTRLVWRSKGQHVGPIKRMGGGSNYIMAFSEDWSEPNKMLVEEIE